MPIRSQAQRGAMYSAAAGKSTLGIPKSVGAEFVASDKPGKLPATVSKAPRGRKDSGPKGRIKALHKQGAISSKAMDKFQQGGRPEVGKPAIVGEKGPEVFVPDEPGRIKAYKEMKQRFKADRDIGSGYQSTDMAETEYSSSRVPRRRD